MAAKKPAKKAAKKAALAKKSAPKKAPPKAAAKPKAVAKPKAAAKPKPAAKPKSGNGQPPFTPAPAVPPATPQTFASGDIARAQMTRLPPLDAVTRTAFARQVTLPELARLGGLTVAVNVLREAGSWVVQIDEARRTHPELARRYGDARFAYFCERVIALEDQLVKEGVRHDAISAARTGERAALESARIERDHLLGMLDPIVRGDPVSTGKLHGVRGDLHDDALAKSLETLAVVAETWLDRAVSDVGARAVVKAFGLGDDDVSRARTAAANLKGARAPQAKGKDLHKHDSPDTNILEGIVLAEMRVALSVFRAARTRDPGLPALVPGPGTRAALSTAHHGARSVPAPAPASP